jgi:hypothetical protein
MGRELYAAYVVAKNAVNRANEWNDLPDGPKYQNDTMSISPAHCRPPMLMRAGQQSCGGKNYWESPQELNQAILEVIVMDQKNIIRKAILLLEENESVALLKTQAFVSELQIKIDNTKTGVS